MIMAAILLLLPVGVVVDAVSLWEWTWLNCIESSPTTTWTNHLSISFTIKMLSPVIISLWSITQENGNFVSCKHDFSTPNFQTFWYNNEDISSRLPNANGNVSFFAKWIQTLLPTGKQLSLCELPEFVIKESTCCWEPWPQRQKGEFKRAESDAWCINLNWLSLWKLNKCFPCNLKRREIAPNKVNLLSKYEIHEPDKQNPFKREQGH